MSTYTQVKEFHKTFGHPCPNELQKDLSPDLIKLRIKLIVEELGEYIAACMNEESNNFLKINHLFRQVEVIVDGLKDGELEYDVIEAADALGDIAVVTNGAAIVSGIDLDAIIAEIHRSNMSKLGSDGKPIYREDGKILKGPGYFKPNIKEILGV